MQQELGLPPSGLGLLGLFSPCRIKSLPRSAGSAGKNPGEKDPLELFGLILAGQCHGIGEAFLGCSWENAALSQRRCPCALCCAPSNPEAVPGACAG